MKCPYTFPYSPYGDHEISHVQRGCHHRDHNEGPALVYAVHDFVYEFYYWQGFLHRIGGPARRVWHWESGRLTEEYYYVCDKFHRDPSEGPAATMFIDGQPFTHQFRFWGKYYRDPAEGPCKQWEDTLGRVQTRFSAAARDLTKERERLPQRIDRFFQKHRRGLPAGRHDYNYHPEDVGVYPYSRYSFGPK